MRVKLVREYAHRLTWQVRTKGGFLGRVVHTTQEDWEAFGKWAHPLGRFSTRKAAVDAVERAAKEAQ